LQDPAEELLPCATLRRMFDRFFRDDASRSYGGDQQHHCHRAPA